MQDLINAFQYIEHLENSDYNFINVNSFIENDENDMYAFNINKIYFEFRLYNMENVLILAKKLNNTMCNIQLYLGDIENVYNNYDFIYIQEIISDNYKSIILKYNLIYNVLKCIDIDMVNLVKTFNEIVKIFNKKIMLIKMFPCVDNIIYIYKYNIDNNFSKTLVNKIYIPQIEIVKTWKENIEKPKKTIFTSAYNAFFDEHVNCLPSKRINIDNHCSDHKYELFDSNIINDIDYTDYIIHLGKDYIRFSEYDITTDIFYSRLSSVISKLYAIIQK
jgi:hypothetical protein